MLVCVFGGYGRGVYFVLVCVCVCVCVCECVHMVHLYQDPSVCLVCFSDYRLSTCIILTKKTAYFCSPNL